jgi:hypothetical protein
MFKLLWGILFFALPQASLATTLPVRELALARVDSVRVIQKFFRPGLVVDTGLSDLYYVDRIGDHIRVRHVALSGKWARRSAATYSSDFKLLDSTSRLETPRPQEYRIFWPTPTTSVAELTLDGELTRRVVEQWSAQGLVRRVTYRDSSDFSIEDRVYNKDGVARVVFTEGFGRDTSRRDTLQTIIYSYKPRTVVSERRIYYKGLEANDQYLQRIETHDSLGRVIEWSESGKAETGAAFERTRYLANGGRVVEGGVFSFSPDNRPDTVLTTPVRSLRSVITYDSLGREITSESINNGQRISVVRKVYNPIGKLDTRTSEEFYNLQDGQPMTSTLIYTYTSTGLLTNEVYLRGDTIHRIAEYKYFPELR